MLYDGLGATIAENFYFPYVKKLWGLDPDQLAVTLAERRVSGSSVGKILGKMIRMLPGLRSPTTGRFYYPRKGFGQISEAMAEAARKGGADFRFSTRISRIEREGNRVTAIWTGAPGEERRRRPARSCRPSRSPTLVRLMDPPAPPEVLAAADAIRYRGMILIYLILETPLHRVRCPLLPRTVDPDQPDVRAEELQRRERAEGRHAALRRTAAIRASPGGR